MKMKKGDKWLYLSLLALSCVFAAARRASNSSAGGLVLEVVLMGDIVAERPLPAAGREELLFGKPGRRNVLAVEDGVVRMISADCPGGDCVRMRPLDSPAGSIVCLPHRMIVRLKSRSERDEDELDAVSY